jgi:DNA primase
MTSEPSRDQLLAANEDAAEFYRRQLLGPDADGPRSYLTNRGFASLLDRTPWTVGHAPASWTALHDHLADRGYSDKTQLAAGLVFISRRGHLIDRFRDRITFGIRDQHDQLVGYTARSGPDGREPKYLNTAKTGLYDKGQVLFGLGEATRSSAATCVLVEGPLDAIAMSIASPTTVAALALCGTAVTGTHAQMIRSTPYERLVLALDGDPAGARALERATAILNDDRTRAVHCPGHDPASVLATDGPTALSHSLSSARPAVAVLLGLTLAKWPDRLENAEAAIACLREAAAMIGRLKPADVAGLAVGLSRETSLTTLTVTNELTSALSSSAPGRVDPTHHRVTHGHSHPPEPRPCRATS